MSEAHPGDAGLHRDDPAHHPPPTGPSAMATTNKKRPRLDLNLQGGREHKRGKSMFGILLGTLNKAKVEDKERNASEAAKKRQLIEQRLQNKLRKETDSVRRAEEAKKDKTTANRKEEELQLKDSIYKLRRTRLPILANFLLTSDNISSDSSISPKDILSSAQRAHPPPLYYLPAILTPAQEEFLARRKSEVQEAAEKEWSAFRIERTAGIEEIKQLRERVLEEEARKKAEQELAKQSTDAAAVTATATATDAEHDVDMDVVDTTTTTTVAPGEGAAPAIANASTAAAVGGGVIDKTDGRNADQEVDMDVDVGGTRGDGKDGKEALQAERKDDSAAMAMQGDDDDAVEY